MQLCTAKGPVAASWAGEGSAAQSSPGMPFGSHQASQIPGGPWSAFRDQSQAGAPEQSPQMTLETPPTACVNIALVL